MYIPSEEGVTHINAYSKSNTKLGRLLSNFCHTPFQCRDGIFKSVEGYWYWLSTNHSERDRLRLAYGYNAKKLGRELRGDDWPADPEFQEKILKACWQKIIQNADVKTELRDSTLPIVHYYEYGGKVVVPEQGKWIWEWYEKARNYLKENPHI